MEQNLRKREEGCQTQKALTSTLRTSGGEIKKQNRPSPPHAMMEEKLEFEIQLDPEN